MASRRRTGRARSPARRKSAKRALGKSRAKPARKPVKRPRVQPWFQNLNRDHAQQLAERFYRAQVRAGMLPAAELATAVAERRAELQDRARGREWEYLSDAVKQLRRYYKGFDPVSGFNLHAIDTWSAASVNKVRSFTEDLRIRLARPHTTARPTRYRKPAKRSQFRRALILESGQVGARVKRFVVPVQNIPRRQEVALSPQGTLERRSYYKKDKYILERWWYFRDYLGRQPVTREEYLEAAQAMLPALPDFMFFRFFTGRSGLIGVTFDKGQLLDELRRYFGTGYNTQDFSTTLLGVGFIGDERQAHRNEMRQFKRTVERERQKTLAGRMHRRRQKFYARQRKLHQKFIDQERLHAAQRVRATKPRKVKRARKPK